MPLISVLLGEAGLAQRVHHAQLIPGQLYVDVEVKAGEALAGKVLKRLLERERRCASACPRSRALQAARRCRRGAR